MAIQIVDRLLVENCDINSVTEMEILCPRITQLFILPKHIFCVILFLPAIA